ncbi:MAG: tyrosine-type recombinase/integrase, partial [Firmicutes bacterium]|nr:tyrosine-type recombinase/integrase [Bacillota bacterium]
DDGYIFSINGEPCSYYAIEDLYRKYSRTMGLSNNKPSHTSRRTTLTKLLDGHVHLDSVQKMAGHCDKMTTLSNYYYDRSSAEEKVLLVEQAKAN